MRVSKRKADIFRLAINLFEEGYSFGFCDALTKAYYGVMKKHSEGPLRDIFSEIWKHKPVNCHSVYWFNIKEEGIKKRIKILRDEIEILNNKSFRDDMVAIIRRIIGLKWIEFNNARKYETGRNNE